MKAMVLGIVLAVAVACAQTEGSKPSGDTENKLMQIEQEILDSLLKADTSAFERYAAETATFTDPDGMVIDKARLLGDVKSGALKIQSSKLSDMKVRVYGDMAVVTYGSTDKSSYKGKDTSGPYRWTDVFVNAGGQWKIVAGQGTRVNQQQ